MEPHELYHGNYKIPGVSQASILFSAAVAMFLLASRLINDSSFYGKGAVMEALFVGLPAIIFLLAFKYDLKYVLRLNRIKLSTVLTVVLLMPFAAFTVGIINTVFLFLIRQVFGRVVLVQLPAVTDMRTLMLSLVVVAVSAGICEELLFRGVIMRGFERLGPAAAITVSAVLFGFMHFDFQKLAGTTLLGALIGYMVYRSNSIFTGMLAHFANNAISLVSMYISYLATKLLNPDKLNEFSSSVSYTDLPENLLEGVPHDILPGVLVWLGFFCVSMLVVCIGLIALFNYTTRNTEARQPEMNGNEKIIPGILWLVPGIALVGYEYFVLASALLGMETYGAVGVGGLIKRFAAHVIAFLAGVT